MDEIFIEKPIKSRRNLERFVKLRVEANSAFVSEDVLHGFLQMEPNYRYLSPTSTE
jgi:hypothetical protein